MVRSCTGQNSKTTNKWKVDQHHQANLTINLRSKSIKNLTNNDRQSRQNAQPYKALKYVSILLNSCEMVMFQFLILHSVRNPMHENFTIQIYGIHLQFRCKYMGCKEDKDFKSHCKAWNETTGNEKSEARRKNR